jgi:hypothetical protein
MGKKVVTSVRQLQYMYFGKDLCGNFVSETIEQATLLITNTLKHQKVLIFTNRPNHTKK